MSKNLPTLEELNNNLKSSSESLPTLEELNNDLKKKDESSESSDIEVSSEESTTSSEVSDSEVQSTESDTDVNQLIEEDATQDYEESTPISDFVQDIPNKVFGAISGLKRLRAATGEFLFGETLGSAMEKAAVTGMSKKIHEDRAEKAAIEINEAEANKKRDDAIQTSLIKNYNEEEYTSELNRISTALELGHLDGETLKGEQKRNLENKKKHLQNTLTSYKMASEDISFEDFVQNYSSDNTTERYNELKSELEYKKAVKRDEILNKGIHSKDSQLDVDEINSKIEELKINYEIRKDSAKNKILSNKKYDYQGKEVSFSELFSENERINTEAEKINKKLGDVSSKIEYFNENNEASRSLSNKIQSEYNSLIGDVQSKYQSLADNATSQEELDKINADFNLASKNLHAEIIAKHQDEIDSIDKINREYNNYSKLIESYNKLSEESNAIKETGIADDFNDIKSRGDNLTNKLNQFNKTQESLSLLREDVQSVDEELHKKAEDFVRKHTGEFGVGVLSGAKAFGKSILGGIVSIGKDIAGGGEYGAFESWVDNFHDGIESAYGTSSKYQRSIYENRATLDGNDIVFGDDGKIQAVYNKDGYIHENPKEVISKYESLGKNAPSINKGAVNEELIWNGFTKTTGDMLAIIMPSSRLSKGFQILGAGTKVSRYAGLTLSGYLAQADDLYYEAVDAGMSRGNARNFSLVTGALLGALENISPQEALISGVGKKAIISKAVDVFKDKTITRREASKYVMNLVKQEVKQENVQEIFQSISEKGIKAAYNKGLDQDFFDTDFSMNELKETVLLTTLSTGAVTTVSQRKSIKNPSIIKQNALYHMLEDGESTKAIKAIRDKVDTGEWSQEQGDIAINTIQLAEQAWSKIPENSDLSPRQKAALVSLMSSKFELEKGKSDVESLNNVSNALIEEIDNDIESVISGEYFETKEGSHAVGNELYNFAMQSKEEGGLGMTLKEAVELRKKAKEEGVENLTKEEQESVSKFTDKLKEITEKEDARFEAQAIENLKKEGVDNPSREQLFLEKQKVIKSENIEISDIAQEYAEQLRTEKEIAEAKEKGVEGLSGTTIVNNENTDVIKELTNKAVTTSQKVALSHVENALTALGKHVPGAQFQIHATSADMMAATQDVQGVDGTERGMWVAEDGTIHVNMENVKENTIPHEAVHPILESIKENNPELHSKIESDLINHIKETPELKKYLDFGKNYDDKDAADESITEFLADVISGKTELPPKERKSLWQSIKEFLYKNGIDLGLTKEHVNKMSFEETLDVARNIIGAVKEGKEFDVKKTQDAPKKERKPKTGKRQMMTEDYRMSHSAPRNEGKNSLDDFSEMFPDSPNDANFERYYGMRGEYAAADKETISVMREAHGNPNADVTIYRAVPEGVDNINAGDWVSTSKIYATKHGERHIEGGFNVVELTVKANEIHTDGDLHEWGYNPRKKAKKQNIGRQGAKNFENKVLDNLQLAVMLDKRGDNPTDIKIETGWERGVDGKWRWEISDDKVEFSDFINEKPETLGELMNHPELFKAYPQLKDMPFNVRLVSEKKNVGGGYLGIKGGIELLMHQSAIDKINSNHKESADALKAMKGTIHHEIQHAIQEIEGHHLGGNLSIAEDYINSLDKHEDKKILNTLNKAIEASENSIKEIDPRRGKEALKIEKENLKKAKEHKDNILKKTYKKIAGEVEARNVSDRRELTSEQRLQNPLKSTRDVDFSDVVFLQKSLYSSFLSESKKSLKKISKKQKSKKSIDKDIMRESLNKKFLEGHYKKADFIKDATKGELVGHGLNKKELERLWQDAALEAKSRRIGEAIGKKIESKKLKAEFKEFYDVKQKDFKAKLSDLKQQLKALKDATKEEKKIIKDTINQVKKEFVEYLNESGLDKFGITKRLLKLANDANSVEGLKKFIEASDTYIEKQLRTDLKRVINNEVKNIEKRLDKGEYTNQTELIEELVGMAINSITDKNLLTEVAMTLSAVNRKGVAIVVPEDIQNLINRVENHNTENQTLQDALTNQEMEELEKLGSKKKKEEIINRLEQQNVNIVESLESLSNRDLDVDDFDTDEALVDVKRQMNRIKRLISSYSDANNGDVSNISQSINMYNSMNDIYNNMVENYNKNKYNLSKDILNNLTKEDISKFTPHQISMIEELKDSEFINDTKVNNNLLAIAYDLSYGYIPSSAINDILNASYAEKHGEKLSNLIDEGVNNREESTSLDVGERSSAKTLLKSQQKNIGYLDYIYGIKDNFLAKYITPLMNRAESSMKRDIDSAKAKFAKAVKGLPLSLSSKNKQRTMIKLGMIAHQNQENLNHDSPRDMWGDIINNPSILEEYGDDSKIYREMYNSLPKDKDGNVDVDAAMKGLSKAESNVLNAFNDIIKNDLRPKQKHANEISGKKFTDYEGYVPVISVSKLTKLSQDVRKETENWLKSQFSNTKIKSDRGKARTDRKTKPIHADLGLLFNNAVIQVNREFHFTPSIQKLNSVMNKALESKSSNPLTNNHIQSLKARYKDGIENLFNNTFMDNALGKMSKVMMKVTYVHALVRAMKPFLDFIGDASKMNIKAGNIYTPEILARGAVERVRRNMSKISDALNFSSGLADKNDTTFQKLLKLTDSPWLIKYNRHLIEGSSDVSSPNKETMAEWMMGFGDRNTVHMVWMPTFMAEFKKVTGKKFDYNKFNSDSNYASEHANAINEASAVADNQSMIWKDAPTKSGRRTKIRFAPIVKGGTIDADSPAAPYLTYMTNYGFQEAMQTGLALTNMWEGAKNFDKRFITGLRELTAITFSGVTYGILVGAEYGLSMMAIAGMSGDEEEYEKWRQKVKDNFSKDDTLKHVISHFTFLASSKYGQASRVVMLASLGTLKESGALTKEQEDYMTKMSRDYMFADPITYNKYKGEKGLLKAVAPPLALYWDYFNYFSAEGNDLANALEDAKYYEDGKYREEVAWLSFGNSLAKLTMILSGKPLPLMKETDRLVKDLDERFNYKVRERKSSTGEDKRFPWFTPKTQEQGKTRKSRLKSKRKRRLK